MDCLPEGLLMAGNYTCHGASQRLTKQGQVEIDMLPEDVLLEIFDFYMHQARRYPFQGIEAWHTLIHVCRHWRNIVFGSPLRLNLQLLCTATTPVRETLEVWPPLPIRIRENGSISDDVDNIIAILEHNDRICEIVLYEVPNLLMGMVSTALMRKPFPALTQLELVSHSDSETAVPHGPFSGGSALRLREVLLDGIPFSELPKLLLSAPHLVYLTLLDIPWEGYISPEATVNLLSVLKSLEQFHLEFQLPRSPSHPLPRPPKRFVLPSLTKFTFRGVNNYLEDLVGQIDAPGLNHLSINLFNQLVLDSSQLVHFLSRTPSLKRCDEAHVVFHNGAARVTFSSWNPNTGDSGELNVKISGGVFHSELPSLEQICSSFSPPLFTVENLYIQKHRYLESDWEYDDIEGTEWLVLLRPFTTVKDLYLCEVFASHITLALQELVKEEMTEVLPILQNIFLEGLRQSGPAPEDISQFVAARQLSGHFITLSGWVRTPQEDSN